MLVVRQCSYRAKGSYVANVNAEVAFIYLFVHDRATF